MGMNVEAGYDYEILNSCCYYGLVAGSDASRVGLRCGGLLNCVCDCLLEYLEEENHNEMASSLCLQQSLLMISQHIGKKLIVYLWMLVSNFKTKC